MERMCTKPNSVRSAYGRSSDNRSQRPNSPGESVDSVGKIIEMLRFVDPHNADAPANHVDLVNAARRLCKAPIGGQRLIDQLNQQGTIQAGMAYQHDRVLSMPVENEPKR